MRPIVHARTLRPGRDTTRATLTVQVRQGLVAVLHSGLDGCALTPGDARQVSAAFAYAASLADEQELEPNPVGLEVCALPPPSPDPCWLEIEALGAAARALAELAARLRDGEVVRVAELDAAWAAYRDAEERLHRAIARTASLSALADKVVGPGGAEAVMIQRAAANQAGAEGFDHDPTTAAMSLIESPPGRVPYAPPPAPRRYGHLSVVRNQEPRP